MNRNSLEPFNLSVGRNVDQILGDKLWTTKELQKCKAYLGNRIETFLKVLIFFVVHFNEISTQDIEVVVENITPSKITMQTVAHTHSYTYKTT